MKPKKGISDVISTVLIILLIMVTIPSIYFPQHSRKYWDLPFL